MKGTFCFTFEALGAAEDAGAEDVDFHQLAADHVDRGTRFSPP